MRGKENPEQIFNKESKKKTVLKTSNEWMGTGKNKVEEPLVGGGDSLLRI